MNISIVSGWLPLLMCSLAVVTLVLALDWSGGGWRRQLGKGVPVAVVVTAVAVLVLTVASALPSGVLWAVYLAGFALVLSVWVAATGWSGAGWARHLVAVIAVVFTLLVTLGAINRQAGSFPTLDRLIALDPEDVATNPQLQQMRDQVVASGKLPDHGVVIAEAIPATVSHFSTRPAFVYLPPAWFAKVTPSLPTLVLLPGEPGSASDWSGAGDADNTADAFAQAHHGIAPIIVMPDPNGFATEDSECVNSKFGNAETYLTVDVPAFARQRFSASKAPGSLAIGGLSAGGTCSIMLTLRHPEVYPTFASFSGFASPQYKETDLSETIDDLFGGSRAAFDAHDPAQLLRNGHFDGVAGWFEVGEQDADPLTAAHQLQPAALAAGIATCILVDPGGHDYDLWSQALQDAFPWLSWRLGLTAEPKTEPAHCQQP